MKACIERWGQRSCVVRNSSSAWMVTASFGVYRDEGISPCLIAEAATEASPARWNTSAPYQPISSQYKMYKV